MRIAALFLSVAVLMLHLSVPASAVETQLPEPTGCSGSSDALPNTSEKRPVVYVHGWTSSGASMDSASAALQAALGTNYAVYRFDYAALATTWPVGTKAADCLAYYLQSAADSYEGAEGGVLAVAHSMGGIAVRSAAKVLTDTGSTDTLIGIVTIGTPHRGTPLGGTLLAEVLEAANELVSVWKHAGARAPVAAGTDAARCLASASGCSLPPYVEGDHRIASIGTQVTLERQLFGMNWLLDDSRVQVFGDAIVPVSSSTGYYESGPGVYTTTQLIGSSTIECLESTGELMSATSLITGIGIVGVANDLRAAESFRTGRAEPKQLPYTVAALGSECSHLNLLTEPRIVAQARDYLLAMEEAAGRTTEERVLDRHRWLYEITSAASDGTGGHTDVRFGTGAESRLNSTAHALGCSAEAATTHTYDLEGIYESLVATVGNRLGSDPTLTSHWTIDIDGEAATFALTGRATKSLSLNLTGAQTLTVEAYAAGNGCDAHVPIGVLGDAYVVEVHDITPGTTENGANSGQNLAAVHGWPTNRHDSNSGFHIWLGAASAWGKVKMGMVDWLACDDNDTCVGGTENEVLVTAVGRGGRVVIGEFTATEPAVEKLKSFNATDEELTQLLRNTTE